MEQYFFKITHSYTDKNKLYADFSKYVRSLDSTLIKDQASLEAFKNLLELELKNLNEKHSRCKPIQLSGHSFMGESIFVSGSWTASIYKVERAVELEDGFLQTFIK